MVPAQGLFSLEGHEVSLHINPLSVFEINHRRPMKGVNILHLDDIVLNRDNPAPTHTDEVGTDRRMGGKNPSQGIFGVSPGMHLKRGAFFGGIIPVKPVQHRDKRKSFQTQQTGRVFFIQHNKGPALFLYHFSDGVYVQCLRPVRFGVAEGCWGEKKYTH